MLKVTAKSKFGLEQEFKSVEFTLDRRSGKTYATVTGEGLYLNRNRLHVFAEVDGEDIDVSEAEK